MPVNHRKGHYDDSAATAAIYWPPHTKLSSVRFATNSYANGWYVEAAEHIRSNYPNAVIQPHDRDGETVEVSFWLTKEDHRVQGRAGTIVCE